MTNMRTEFDEREPWEEASLLSEHEAVPPVFALEEWTAQFGEAVIDSEARRL